MTEPTNFDKCMAIISQGLHLRWSEEYDAAHGITQEEHNRRHYIWVSGVLTGLQLLADYNKLGASVFKIVKSDEKSKEFVLPFTADFLARQLGDTLVGLKPSQDRLEEIANQVTVGARNTRIEAVKAEFGDDGQLTWAYKKAEERPLPTWRDEFEEWEEAE